MDVGVLGIGHYVPAKVVTNQDLEKIVDTNDEWIRYANWNRRKKNCRR